MNGCGPELTAMAPSGRANGDEGDCAFTPVWATFCIVSDGLSCDPPQPANAIIMAQTPNAQGTNTEIVIDLFVIFFFFFFS